MTDTGELFPGDGELARRLRALDWSSTELGSTERWPEPLRVAVRICLASPAPMSVWWGPQLALICNEACAALLGDPSPGRNGRESCAELWTAIGPPIERALETGEAVHTDDLELFLARALPHEEVFVRLACTPLLLPGAAAPAGVLAACVETTEQVVRARRLETLSRIGLETAKARTLQTTCSAAMRALGRDRPDVPFAAVYLVDERQGARLVAMTGLPIEHSLPTAITDAEPDRGPWPLAGVLQKRRPAELEGIDAALPPLAGHPWPEPVRRAIALPLFTPRDAIAGLMVAGVSPRRIWDGGYRAFFEEIAGQLSASLGLTKAYQDERRRAEALAEVDRVKTAYFSNISHELRVPLTLLLAPVTSAVSAPEPSLSGAELEVVHRNAQHLLRRVNTLLDFVGIEEGRVRANYRPVDLSALTADIAIGFRSAIEKAGLELVVDCPPLPEPVHVDREMWEKIVLNLLSNALKFTFEGTIIVALRATDEGARLTVSDTGVGIAADALPRLFERFRRVEEPRARSREGSGIGLALVQELVRLHDGRLDVQSATGIGTMFGVTIPFGERQGLNAGPDLNAGAEDTEAPATPTAMPFVSEAMQWLQAAPPAEAEGAVDRHVHILIADDNADMTSYLKRLLSKRWNVESVSDGMTALEAIRRRRPSLVLTDMVMPNLDGFGLLHALRSDPSTASLPVIMLSARSGEHAEAALEAGADDYIVKPFSARELVARVAARLEVDRIGTRLAQERAAIAEVFRQTPVPVCMFRGRGLVYESANDAYQAALDLDVRGKSLFEVAPSLARQFGVVLHDVMDTGRPFVGREVMLTLKRYGRVEQTYWTLLFAQLPGHSNEKYVVAICNEVTEQVVGRKQLEELAERADAANRTKDDFLAMLGHELRNPLSPIVTSLQLLRMRDIHSPEQDIVERQVNHLRRLVDDLLDVSRIARGKIELRRERIEVSEVLAAAIETSSPLFEQRQHRVDVEVPRTGLVIDADPDRMAQVFSNLMTNAVKYSEPGTRIAIEARRIGERVRVRVIDEGAGIAADMIDKVFDMFVQQAQTIERSRGGLGLGLSIVKSLVELHGGKVSARSEGVGRGTELTVELPAATEAERAQPVVEPVLMGGGVVKRILVVDDNDDAALSLKKALERLGYAVAIAHDGPAALRAAAVFEPEIALLDIGLPVMDGYELARRLRALRRLHLVALSGYGQEADRKRSAEAGFEVHLTKPVDLRHLESVVRSLD